MQSGSSTPDGDTHGARTAQLVRTISSAGGVTARSIIGSNLVADAMELRTMAPTATNALGRAMMGAVLIAVGAGATADPGEDSSEIDPDSVETVQLQLRGDGPLGSIVAISDSLGRVRGTVQNPDVELALPDGTPDVARAIGLGTLTVVRHRPSWREPYSGTVPLVSGEVASDITLYLSESEQTPSAMGLGVATLKDESAVAAAGFLVQIMPDATSEEIERAEANVLAMPPMSEMVLAGTNCHAILDALLDGLGSRDRHEAAPLFYCPCTRERAHRTLSLLGRGELRGMIRRGESQEVRCHFCGRAYDFAGDDLGVVLPDA
jgi:molecular chaperone Hsp33